MGAMTREDVEMKIQAIEDIVREWTSEYDKDNEASRDAHSVHSSTAHEFRHDRSISPSIAMCKRSREEGDGPNPCVAPFSKHRRIQEKEEIVSQNAQIRHKSDKKDTHAMFAKTQRPFPGKGHSDQDDHRRARIREEDWERQKRRPEQLERISNRKVSVDTDR